MMRSRICFVSDRAGEAGRTSGASGREGKRISEEKRDLKRVRDPYFPDGDGKY